MCRDKPTGRKKDQFTAEVSKEAMNASNEREDREKNEAALEVQWAAYQYMKRNGNVIKCEECSRRRACIKEKNENDDTLRNLYSLDHGTHPLV